LDAPGFQLFARYGGVLAVVAGRMLSEQGVLTSVPWMVNAGSVLMWMGASFFVVSVVSYFGSKIGKLLLRDGIEIRGGTHRTVILEAARYFFCEVVAHFHIRRKNEALAF